jgi:RNA polymerase sigma-70 factor, ECF subfamily
MMDRAGAADFQDFYQANYGRIVALMTAVLHDRHEAEDVAQEAFARALARWPRLAGYDLPEAWVRRVALRIGTDTGRRARRAVRAALRLSGSPPREPEPGDGFAFTAVGGALGRLPLREREVIVLHYLADLSVDAIARDCGVAPGTVKSRLAAGRRHLEDELCASGEAISNDR